MFSSDLDKLYDAGERFLKEQWYLTGEAENLRNERQKLVTELRELKKIRNQAEEERKKADKEG